MDADQLKKILSLSEDNNVQSGDEDQKANNLRNYLASKVNPILPNNFQIPEMSVADEKRYYNNLPEQIAGSTMGSVNVIDSAPARFSRLLQNGENRITPNQILNHPEVQAFKANKANFIKENPHPSQYQNGLQQVMDKVRQGLLNE